MIDTSRLNPVIEQVSTFRDAQWRRHTLNFIANWLLVVLAICASALTIIGGVCAWDHRTIALIGVAGSIIVSIQTSLAINDKAEFQRVIATDAENIILLLSDPLISDEDFSKLRDQFTALRAEASKKLPRGGGVEAARKLPNIS